jgi:hypothetical protein
MRLDDIRAYLIANLATFATARSLATLSSDFIRAGPYQQPNGTASLWLVDGEEEAAPLSCSTREAILPVQIYAFVSGGTEEALREQALQYAEAVLDCLGAYPDFVGLTGREHFDGVEGNEGMKATRIDLEFRYEESL